MVNKEKYINKIRLTGLLFILTFIIPILNWLYIFSRLIDKGNPAITIRNIISNNLLIRWGITIELLSSILIISFSISLYSVLKELNKNIALLAVLFRSVEAIVTITIAAGHFAVLLILKNQSISQMVDHNMVLNLLGSFYNIYLSLTAVLGIFYGLSMGLFFILLYKSKYLPRSVSGIGILAYILVVLYDTAQVLYPDIISSQVIAIIANFPVCIIQICAGLWFLLGCPRRLYKDSDAYAGN